MQALQGDYFSAYRSLNLTRDANAVLVGYGLALEGASAADLVKSMQAKSEPVARKGKSA